MKYKQYVITFLIEVVVAIALVLGINNQVIFNPNIANNVSVVYASDIPTAYNNDYNNVMYSTSVKDQDPYGMCWAFSVVACAETDAIKNHGASENIDLSEWHLSYFLYNGERTDTGDTVLEGDIPYYDCGGNAMFSAFVLSNWIGFADESVAPFSTLVNNSNATIPSSKMYEHEYVVDNIYMYEPDEITNVKNAILTYGAVSTSYCCATNFLNETTYAQYCKTAYTADHAVTVVGWDDNYSKSNFYTSLGGTPSSDGAWLVKNSWGESWGLNGYFWLSYEDATIAYFSAIDVVPDGTYNSLYQHDGGVSPIYYSTSISPLANVFTAEKDELLTAVGILTYDTSPKQSSYDYTINIYKNPSSLNASVSGFNFTNLVYTQTGIIPTTGYTNIQLNQGVVLSEGDTFVVSVKCDAPIGVDCDWSESDGTNTITTSDVTVLEHQTYYYYSGYSKWYDASTISLCDTTFNARIKALTLIGEAELETAPTMENVGYGVSLSNATLTGGKVIDNLTNLEIEGTWSFVDTSIVPVVGETITVKFVPNSQDYETITTTITANVSLVTPTITISTSKQNYSVGEQVYLTVNVANSNNVNLTDTGSVVVTYSVAGGTAQTINGLSFTIPTSASNKDVITITVKCLAVSGKYLQSTATYTINVVYQTTVSSLPSATSIYYGQNLTNSVLSGGLIIDSYSLETVLGEWQFIYPEVVPTETENQLVKFIPQNSNYSEIYKSIKVEVVKVEPVITITLNNTEFEVGDQVIVSVTLENSYNLSLEDFGDISLYYIIDGSQTKTQIVNNSFIVTGAMSGKQISIVAEIEGVEGKYEQSTKSLTTSVLQTEISDDQTNTEEQPNEDVEEDLGKDDSDEENDDIVTEPSDDETTNTEQDSQDKNDGTTDTSNNGSNAETDTESKEDTNTDVDNTNTNTSTEENGGTLPDETNPEQEVNTKIVMYGLIALFGVPILLMVISLIIKRKRF